MPAYRKKSSKPNQILVRIAEDLRALRPPCFCGQPIDYSVKTPHPDAFTIDHIKPRSLFPELAFDPNNIQAAHYSCNLRKSDENPQPVLGVRSREW